MVTVAWRLITAFQVGIISFSITRLKQTKRTRLARRLLRVGIISFSITRLKHQIKVVDDIANSLRWNHKFLDYEIET